MAEKLHIDFETRSVVDLRQFGLDVYVNHPSTDAWCMAYAFGDENIEYWRMGQPLPERVRRHVEEGGVVAGHKVDFEWHIWNYVMKKKYNWPTLKLSQCDCTMARAYAMSLPGSLENVAKALNLPMNKDMGGRALMLKMCKPRKINEDGSIVWWDDEERQMRQIKYCIHDVAVEREADKLLLPLSKRERELWLLDQRINLRGIGVDREAVEITQQMVNRVVKLLNKEMKLFTGGQIKAVTEATNILNWCHEHNVFIDDLKKFTVDATLADPDIPEEVRTVLELRTNAKASIAKLQKALDMSLVDSRCRAQFQYYGANTGRWAGRGVQFHNLPRPEKEWEDPDFQHWLIDQITKKNIDEHFIAEWYGPPMRVLSSSIRGYFVAAPGHDFVGADLKNIEGVGLAWLANEEWKLQAFSDNYFADGPGIYEIGASKNLNIPIDQIDGKQRLEWGKVPELALGFGGGKGAFKSMAVNYGIKISDDKAEDIKVRWRKQNSRIQSYWYEAEEAAIKAVANPGLKCFFGPKDRQICYRVAGSFLWCQLPSGRVLCYPYPQLQEVETPWGAMKMAVTYMTVDGRMNSKTKGKFVRMSTYGGKLVENITQAFARDILVEGMFRVEGAGYPIVLHVHDESVSEVDLGFGSKEEYENLMSIVPPWASGLPLAADGFRGTRYRK